MNFQPEPTGNAPYTTDLVEALGDDKQVEVITGYPYYPSWIKNLEVQDGSFLSENQSVRLRRINHYVPRNPTNLKRLLMEVSFGVLAVTKGNLDSRAVVLVTPALISSVIVMAWIRIRHPKTKILVWVQDLYSQGVRETSGSDGISSKFLDVLENKFLNSADQVIFAHDSFLRIKKARIQDGTKLHVIRNWSQFSIEPNLSRFETRVKFGIEDSFVVLHIGNMGIKQGLENVVASAKLVQQDKQRVQFVFVGGGNQENKLREMAEGTKSAIFLGTVSDDDLSNLLLAADLLLVNEKVGVKEMSIPSKLTTYFQTRTPTLVCSERDSNAAKEVLSENIGFWVKSGDPQALLDAVTSIANQRDNSVGERAFEYSKKVLDKGLAGGQFKQFLSKI
jgi:glycosyltransferase involved in cell wall biosynthesis